MSLIMFGWHKVLEMLNCFYLSSKRDIFIQNWNDKTLAEHPFYRTFSDFNFQAYLDLVNIPKFRIALSKLRVSAHILEIEAGR